MYKVIEAFTDLQDSNYVYFRGDDYPRKGKKLDEARVEELSNTQNRLGRALIQAVNTPDEGKPVHEEEQPKKPTRSRKKAM